eukprot:175455_1
MADEYLFYEEDYDDISDWDEESDENNNDTNNISTPDKSSPTKSPLKQDESEEKKYSIASNTNMNKNGLSYIPKSTSSSFIRHKYSVMTQKDMKQHIRNLIGELSLTLNIDIEIVSLLLRKYEWKTDRLMENYLSNSLKCLNEHNLHLINKKNDAKLTANSDLMIECNICINDVKISSTFSLDCNHRFCNDCWSDYIVSTINSKSFNSIFITCPGHKCNTPIKNIIIKQFTDKSQYNKYENYILQSYITYNSHQYRFCPSPGCNYILYCNDTTPKSLINENNLNKTPKKITSTSNNINKKKYKSKYKQKQQQLKEEEAAKKKYNKLPSDLEGFSFVGQTTNSKGSNKKSTLLKKYKNKKPNKSEIETTKTKTKPKPTNIISKGHVLGSKFRDISEGVFIQCKCGFDLCFLCLEEYHAPATCFQVENWNFKCLKESENAQWIVTNTKKCPKCFTRIERNHGCNHMVCSKCQYEFCWVCMGSWKEHGIGTGGYYRCNKYKAKSTMGNRQKLAQKEDEELDKFVHYFNRFHNHAASRQFLLESSHKVLRKIKSHLNTNAKDGKSWIDVEFLKNAHDEIFFCRQILKYTYVYAYYLKMGNEKDLFEFLQQDLEKNCEILHELCEQNWKNINANATHIINYTNITHRFVKQLLHGIANGLTR